MEINTSEILIGMSSFLAGVFVGGCIASAISIYYDMKEEK